MEDLLIAIMAQLAEHDGLSDHQIGKRLGIGMSQLNRALALLETSAEQGGLGCVVSRQDGKRRTLWLTERGRALCVPQ
ncbi:hypothetical protein [Andreprevotia chitinilytica]|uniref:hypothetical protein n=1 Tax=Andreprevotia chitinilytica TaxID=396808 RepID=UPI0005536BD5|nr:hypothetical protein [Andreprevotia chitinilytica]